ncbi:MAG: hypothetical protein K6E52_07235 [Bacteroidaceae bacterium]|nr:hypothetical protein [Bacteroidaceae bacterium]
MARKIIMTGDEARYIERRGANAVADDREIRMEGCHARYEENSAAQPAHFPQNHSEAIGKQWFDMLVANGFIERDSELENWLYLMGFSSLQPNEVVPITWLKTKETARMMVTKIHSNLLDTNILTVGMIGKLTSQCFIYKGAPLELSKPKKENSVDADLIENFLPTISDL